MLHFPEMRDRQRASLRTVGRRILSQAVLSVGTLGCLTLGAFGATYTVNVTGSGCASSAQVVAMVFGNQGPDPANTRVVTANTSGVATFSDLDTSISYQFFAVNSGCAPSMRDQAQDPSNAPTQITGGGSRTIALSQDSTSASLTINLTLANSASARLINGGCHNVTSNEDAGFGLASVAAGTSGTLIISGIPPAPSGAYNCGVFSPSDNRGGGLMVNSALSAGANTTVSLDLTQSFAPPPGAQTQADRSGQGSGVSNLTVVVTKQSDGSAVSGAQLKLKTSATGNPINFSMTDPNGVGTFFGLTNGATVYLDVIPPGGLQGSVNRSFLSSDWTNQPVSTSVVLSTGTAGTITGTVKIGGVAVPQVWVNCNPDFGAYPGSDFNGGGQPHPAAGFGSVNASTGAFVVSNLSPGNYSCWVNSPFSNQPTFVNAGADGMAAMPSTAGADDWRLSVSTNGVFEVYTSSGGTRLSAGSPITVSIRVDTSTANGSISGTLVFPSNVDLSETPVMMIAHQDFGDTPNSNTPPRSGFAAVNGQGQTQNFTIQVPAGTKYFIEVRGSAYGPLGHGNNIADLTSATSMTLPSIRMVSAGSIHVVVLGPTGSRFLPRLQPQPGQEGSFQNQFCGARVDAQGQNVEAWGGADVSQNGDATLTGLPAGMYRLTFGTYGPGCSVAASGQNGVLVSVNQTTEATLHLQNGVSLEMSHIGSLPDGTGIPGPSAPPDQIAMIAGFPRGTPFTLDNLRQLTGKGGSTAPISLMQARRNINGQPTTLWTGLSGFDSAPLVPPGHYTFRLFVQGFPRFETPGQSPGNFFFTLLGSTSAIVDRAHQTALSSVYGSSVVAVSIPSSFGSATLTGTMSGSRIITADDFNAMGGDFEKFLAYMPVCAVYDRTGEILGFSMGIPPTIDSNVQDIEQAVAAQDVDRFLRDIQAIGGLRYSIPLLSPGTYQEVCTTPNYPPVVQSVTLTANRSTTRDIDFDRLAGPGGTLSGAVTAASGGSPVVGATVLIQTRTSSKKTTTNAAGAYSFAGLADGIYRLSVSLAGYAQATDKKTVANAATVTVNFALTAAPGNITGTVIAQRFPNRQVAAGVQVVAYDDTQAGLNPTAPPPSWNALTNSTGSYTLNSPFPGHTIKIFAIADGKIIVGTSTVAGAGGVTAPDITLLAIPPVSTVQVDPTGGSSVNIAIAVPKLLASAPTLKCNIGSAYDDSSAVDESSLIVSAPGNTYVAQSVPLPTTTGNNVCRVTTSDGVKRHTVDTVINLTTLRKRSVNTVDRAAILGESISADPDNTAGGGVDFYTGSVVLSMDSVPTAQIVQTDTGTAGIVSSTATFASDVYQITLDSAAEIGSGRNISISLALRKDVVLDPRSIQVAQVINGVVTPIAATPFVDPLTGLVSIDIANISNAASAVNTLGHADSAPSFRGLAPFVARQEYLYSPAAAVTQNGSFVLISTQSSVQGGAYSGAALNAYNFPNPFNLNSKTMPLANGDSLVTNGTILRYDLPAAHGGRVIIRIYTISGQLIRVLDEGDKTGGTTYYTAWDGANMGGQQVASGIYFAVFDVPGLKAKQHVVKMAVLK